MLPTEVLGAYVSMNVIFAVLIMFKSPRNTLSRFYAVGVASLVYFGVLAHYLSYPLPSSVANIFESVALFLFAIIPFLFIHFVIILAGANAFTRSPWLIGTNYLVGVIYFLLLLFRLIPAPLFAEDGLSRYGYMFYLSWQTIFFCAGIALTHSVVSGFFDRHIKVNVLMKGFIILLLLLPGPFTGTLFVGIVPHLGVWFFYSSIAGLVIAVYLIFRHTIIVNTPYEALKATLAVMNDVIIKMDNTFRIELVRGALSQMLGYEEKDLSGRSLSEIVQERNLLQAYRDYVFRGKMKESFFDAQVMCKNGSLLPVFFSLTPIRNGMEVSGFVALGRDITVLRQYERQLRLERDSLELRVKERTEDLKNLNETLQESEQRSRILYELTHDYAYQDRVEPDGRIVVEWMSVGVTRLTGYSLEETKDPDFWQRIIYPDDLPIFLEHTKRILSGQADTLEARIVTKGGKVCWLEETARPIWDAAQGRVVRLYGGARDITGRKQAETALAIQRTYFKQLFDNSPAGIVILDTSDTILNANKAFEQLFQYSTEELLGGKLNAFIVPATLAEEGSKLSKIAQGGEVVQRESRRKRKDGVLIEVNITGYPIVIDGETVGIYGIYVDITERGKLEEQLRQAKKLESLGTLAGGVAHDFNNILAIIMGHASLLQKVQHVPEKLAERIEIIKKASERGAGLVKQLLMFARKTEIALAPVDVNGAVNEIIEFVEQTFPKTIKFSSHLEKGLPSVSADTNQLNQVLINLCVNARDAMQSGGTLTIETLLTAGEIVRAKFFEATATEYVQIDVADTGAGMDEATLSRIFEPFFTTKERGRGTGLGLALVFGIVESHDGFIDVESKRGQGTTFHLYFPALPRSLESYERKNDAIREVAGGTETILLVEDEEMLRDFAKAILVSKGYTVLTAEDGMQGVEMYQSHQDQIAVVLSDIGLPALSGQDVLKRIREMNPKARVVLASGFIDPETKSEMYKAGARYFIQKPYLPDEVLQKIREAIDTDQE